MKTTIYQAEQLKNHVVKSHIKKAILEDELVVFPTETVYGIGANALSTKAVSKIYEAKGRPSDNPLIVHLSKKEDILKYTKNISKYAYPLMDSFWPGPLTLIFESNGLIPSVVTGGLKTIAIRVPSHPVALDIISLCGVPICAPSANISGKPSSTLFEHVKEDFDGRVEIIIDGGLSNIGLESTVLDLTCEIPTILRPGKVTKKMIEDVLFIKIINHLEISKDESPKSPGMKYKHYAPKGEITLVDGKLIDVVNYIQHQIDSLNTIKTACLCPDEYASYLNHQTIIKLGALNNLEKIAENLFLSLRLMDQLGVEKIFIPVIESDGLGQAIMNRLLKAANHHIIKV